MSAPHPSRLARFASFWMQLALRFWPAESRDWGRALAAEIDCIHSPFEALRWALGGTLLFGRALVSHSLAWLQLPISTHVNGGQVLPSTQLPRRSRLFSGALLVTTAAVLCLPQGREALSAVKRSWGFSDYHSDDAVLERIGEQADRENDARTLAFVGLALPHVSCCPLRDRRDTTYYADRAIAIDPSLAWICTGMVRQFGFRTDQSEWMTRLKASDPENAFP